MGSGSTTWVATSGSGARTGTGRTITPSWRRPVRSQTTRRDRATVTTRRRSERPSASCVADLFCAPISTVRGTWSAAAARPKSAAAHRISAFVWSDRDRPWPSFCDGPACGPASRGDGLRGDTGADHRQIGPFVISAGSLVYLGGEYGSGVPSSIGGYFFRLSRSAATIFVTGATTQELCQGDPSPSSFRSVRRLMTFGSGRVSGGSYIFSCQMKCTFQFRHLTADNRSAT